MVITLRESRGQVELLLLSYLDYNHIDIIFIRMDSSILLYINLLLSIVNLGVSYFIWKKVFRKRPAVEVPTKLPAKKDSLPTLKTEPQPLVQDAPPARTIEPTTPVVAPVGFNKWYLEATGNIGQKFSAQVEWSDGSVDVFLDSVVPIELELVQKKGVVPVKVVGIPPHDDVGVNYLWELNGFHWS
jgi:hypothetical protein